MLLRFHPMTRERFRAVEGSAERLELGEMEFELAGQDPGPPHSRPRDRDTPSAGRGPVPTMGP